MLLIFLLSSIPGEIDNPQLKFLTEVDPQWQNLLHVPLFGLLQIFWLRAMTRNRVFKVKTTLICCVVSLSYALFDEWHQMYVPGRFSSLPDMGLNTLGVAIATLLFWWWSKQTKQILNQSHVSGENNDEG